MKRRGDPEQQGTGSQRTRLALPAQGAGRAINTRAWKCLLRVQRIIQGARERAEASIGPSMMSESFKPCLHISLSFRMKRWLRDDSCSHQAALSRSPHAVVREESGAETQSWGGPHLCQSGHEDTQGAGPRACAPAHTGSP